MALPAPARPPARRGLAKGRIKPPPGAAPAFKASQFAT